MPTIQRAEAFFEKIGLTPAVRRWLADHEGVPEREEIVSLLFEAVEKDLPSEYIQRLSSKIAKIRP